MDSGSDDDYDENPSSPPPEQMSPDKTVFLQREQQLCQYNPCMENQEPCTQIAEKTGCLCPGISRGDMPPHPPRISVLQPVSEGDDRGKVEVQWCAPSSVVSKYRVVVQRSDRDPLEFQEFSRKGLVGYLEAGDKVCVEAVNKAGSSIASDFSCKRYDPPGSSDQNLLAGVIGGGVALLLLLIVTAVIFKKCQMCQKAKRDSADGLGNPSYSTEGTL